LATNCTPQDAADARLMAAMAGGDQQALAQLYDRHAGALLGLGVRMLKDRAAAEDLVHDVLLEAWRKAAAYEPERGTVRTWLMLRTRSRAVDRLRSAQHRREVSSESHPVAARPAPQSSDPSLRPDHTRVRVALHELPTDQRHVVELSYLQGMSSSEIARHLKIPMGTVKSRMAAGLSKLRAAFAEPNHPSALAKSTR
jgi:RNA polymerase sigma-70 factor, ECF subfamily